MLQDSYISIWLKKGLSLHFSLLRSTASWTLLLCYLVLYCIWHHGNSGISVCTWYLCSCVSV